MACGSFSSRYWVFVCLLSLVFFASRNSVQGACPIVNETDVTGSNQTCLEETKPCCETTKPCCGAKWFEIDPTLAKIIALTVSLSGLALTFTIIACCFWSKCPLYMACSVPYTHDVPTFYTVDKSDTNLNSMPADANDNQRRLVLTKSSNGGTGPPDVDDKPTAV